MRERSIYIYEERERMKMMKKKRKRKKKKWSRNVPVKYQVRYNRFESDTEISTWGKFNDLT